MNRLRRAWRRWRSDPPPPPLTPQMEFAYRVLRGEVRRRGTQLDPVLAREFEQYERDIEQDRRLARERRS